VITRFSQNTSGMTLIELLIVVAILGIISSFVIPNYMRLKDKATWGVTRANLNVIRRALSNYTTDSLGNKYPVSISGWSGLIAVLPEANLPTTSTDAKILAGSFSYASSDGSDFTLSVTSTNTYDDILSATLAGTFPETYPH